MTARGLTLTAADAEDLGVISARLQDAVARVGDLVYLPRKHRFACLFNRFKWEEGGASLRVRAGLYFEDVSSVRARNFKRGAPDAVVSLLAILFVPKSEGELGGRVELLFSGGGEIVLDVECLDAGLRDVSGPWAALGRPVHETEGG